MNHLEDAFFITRARDIGRRAEGAVLVRGGRVLAEAHGAEPASAIERSGARAEGATLYLSHAPTERTIEALVGLRVGRVVVRGATLPGLRARLSLAGIEVDDVLLVSDLSERKSA